MNREPIDQAGQAKAQPADPKQALPTAPDDEPAEELSEEELRLMADTMPGDGPGGD